MKSYSKINPAFATRSVLIFCILLLTAFTAKSQKFAYVDSDYILEHIPEYNSAQTTLDNLTLQWQKEIETKFAEIDKMYKTYQTESVLLPEEMKRKREDDIIAKEKEVKNLQQKRFGKDGDLTKKREELIKPIQEKIYTALQEIASQGNYAVIFDKAGSISMVFTNPKFDISEEVLTKMGYSY